MLRFLFKIHYLALLAVIGSLLGSLLMLMAGAHEVYEAYLLFFGFTEPTVPGRETVEVSAIILSSLDSFLLGFILLYFAYNLFYLITFPEERENRFGSIKMPPGLKVETLGEMKKNILIVIVVSLSVFLLRENLLSVEGYSWTDLFIPLSIVSVALAVKLIDFTD